MKRNTILTAALLSGAAVTAQGQQLDISITNLTQGIYFTPIIVAAHSADGQLFEVGTMATAELQAMAEGGDISGLAGILSTIDADVAENPAGGMLAPAMSTSTMLDTADGNMYLSIAAMILPTNDGFVGVDRWMIPQEPGTYTFTLNAYDAGTEANDEVINGAGSPGMPGIPAAPGGDGGSGGTGVMTAAEHGYIHIHRGNLGDDDPSGGTSDLNNRIHRWLNPVAKVTVVVN